MCQEIIWILSCMLQSGFVGHAVHFWMLSQKPVNFQSNVQLQYHLFHSYHKLQKGTV